MKKTIIILFTIWILLVLFSQTEYGKVLQYKEQIYLSMYTPVSKKVDLKSGQITYIDGTPIKVTLSSFNYSPTGTTGGYVDIMAREMYLGFRNPDNATPTIDHSVMIHELFHLADLYHNLQRYCENPMESKCAESKAYDFNHLYDQMLELEKKGWVVIKR